MAFPYNKYEAYATKERVFLMIDIIFFAAIAVFVGLKLYNALGSKDFEPTHAAAEHPGVKVVDANYVEIVEAEEDKLEKTFGKKIADKIKEVKKHDPNFHIDSFIAGAKKAFEIIVRAFGDGDKEALKPLLNKDVYKSFSSIIDERASEETIHETTLLAIVSSTIKDIVLSKKYARIAVQIISEQVNLVRDKHGKIIEGNPSHVDKVAEVWTFGRDLTSENPNWELLETATA